MDLLEWSGHGLGGAEACRIALAIRKLAASRPWLKSVRFFGKIFGRSADYYICEVTADPQNRWRHRLRI